MCQFSIFLRVELPKGPYKLDDYSKAWLYTHLKGVLQGLEFGKLSGLEGQGVSGSKGV